MPPSGLAVIRGVDPRSTILPAQLDAICREFVALPYLAIQYDKRALLSCRSTGQCGGHSSLDPRFPIPNRTVKRVCTDDSVQPHAKVGYRQAIHR